MQCAVYGRQLFKKTFCAENFGGVMAQILGPLVDARISVLAMSTFDTDWILVQSHELEAAAQAWRRGGLIYTATTLFGSTA